MKKTNVAPEAVLAMATAGMKGWDTRDGSDARKLAAELGEVV
jgi:hypothetical protein